MIYGATKEFILFNSSFPKHVYASKAYRQIAPVYYTICASR